MRGWLRFGSEVVPIIYTILFNCLGAIIAHLKRTRPTKIEKKGDVRFALKMGDLAKGGYEKWKEYLIFYCLQYKADS